MTAFACRRGPWPGLFLAFASHVSSLELQTPHSPRIPCRSLRPAAMVVHLDQAKIVKLPERTATLVVGNPLIADAVVQPGGVAVITAKSYGATNLVALDRNGATLSDQSIQVVGPADRVVVVYRGIDRETYSCMPNCERRITIGDTAGYFTANLGQTRRVRLAGPGRWRRSREIAVRYDLTRYTARAPDRGMASSQSGTALS